MTIESMLESSGHNTCQCGQLKPVGLPSCDACHWTFKRYVRDDVLIKVIGFIASETFEVCEQCGTSYFADHCVICESNGILRLISWIGNNRERFTKCGYCKNWRYSQNERVKDRFCKSCQDLYRSKYQASIKSVLNLDAEFEFNRQTSQRIEDQLTKFIGFHKSIGKISDFMSMTDMIRLSDWIAMLDRIRENFTDSFDPRLCKLYDSFNQGHYPLGWSAKWKLQALKLGMIASTSKMPGVDALRYIEREFPKDSRKSKMLPILNGASFEYDNGDPDKIEISTGYFITNAEVIAKSISAKTVIQFGINPGNDEQSIFDAGKFKKLMIANKGALRQLVIERGQIKLINQKGYAVLYSQPMREYQLTDKSRIIIQN